MILLLDGRGMPTEVGQGIFPTKSLAPDRLRSQRAALGKEASVFPLFFFMHSTQYTQCQRFDYMEMFLCKGKEEIKANIFSSPTTPSTKSNKMFIVSSSNLMASFSGHLNMHEMPGTSGLEIGQDAADELKHLNLGASCSHTNQNNHCIVEAKQVEMDFATLTNQPFQLTITAPNRKILPCQAGCGHGHWVFELCTFSFDSNQKTIINKTEEKIYLDGVGSLFFTVDDNLTIRLSSQEFLRLPSASQCCSKNKKQ
uniref:Uncharacterized protein n=1 Tax=Ditylenchus dipsaci TaxID=166011 RepID=A0A915D1J6_9BILA